MVIEAKKILLDLRKTTLQEKNLTFQRNYHFLFALR